LSGKAAWAGAAMAIAVNATENSSEANLQRGKGRSLCMECLREQEVQGASMADLLFSSSASSLGRVDVSRTPSFPCSGINCGAVSSPWKSSVRLSPQVFKPSPMPSRRPHFEEPTLNRSLERGIEILRAFRPGADLLGNGEIAERMIEACGLTGLRHPY
jgi:hypothetical protein